MMITGGNIHNISLCRYMMKRRGNDLARTGHAITFRIKQKDSGEHMSTNMCANYREQLEQSIQDEICDAGFYAKIANEAPNNILRELITSIVGDEYGHARLQASLLGICPPPVSGPPDCPAAAGDFRADVETAILGELGAIARYAGLAICAPNLDIRYLLTSILGDEYAHARIWTAMLQAQGLCNNRCDYKDASSYMGARQEASEYSGGCMGGSNYWQN